MVQIVNSADWLEEVIDKPGYTLVDFWATWCGPCKMIAPILEDISNSRDDVRIVKIDVDENVEIANAVGIHAVPSLILYKDGVVVDSFTGAKSKPWINEWLDTALPN